MISRRVSDPTIISPRREGNKYTVWHYRILNPTVHPEDRDTLFDNKGIYNMWGSTVHPTNHVIGLIEFSEPVSQEHLRAILRRQYSGTTLIEPLNRVVHCAKTMALIEDMTKSGGVWAETHNERNSDTESETGEYEPPDEQHFPTHPEEPNPNEVPYDPLDSIADLGERMFAHI